MEKDDRLNLRVRPDLKAEIEILADYYGLTPSSYAHSLLVRMTRQEKLAHPELFPVQVGIDKRGETMPSSKLTLGKKQQKRKTG